MTIRSTLSFIHDPRSWLPFRRENRLTETANESPNLIRRIGERVAFVWVS